VCVCVYVGNIISLSLFIYLFCTDFLKCIFMLRNNCSEYSYGADPSGWNSYSKEYIS
jgi:hypothetical protein